MRVFKKIMQYAAVALFWIAVWWIAALLVGKEVLLPSPAATAKVFAALCTEASFWQICGWSLLRILAGLLLGAAAGVLLAIFTSAFRPAHMLLSPLLSIVRSTPVASFIVLALVWFGRGQVPSFAASLIVLPVVWSSVTAAITEADRQLIEMMQVFSFDPLKRLRHFYIPAVTPAFAAAFRTSLGLAWKAGVAAEVLCTPAFAIGKSLHDAKVYLETAELFAWTITVILLSLLLENLFGFLYKKLEKRGGGGKSA